MTVRRNPDTNFRIAIVDDDPIVRELSDRHRHRRERARSRRDRPNLAKARELLR